MWCFKTKRLQHKHTHMRARQKHDWTSASRDDPRRSPSSREKGENLHFEFLPVKNDQRRSDVVPRLRWSFTSKSRRDVLTELKLVRGWKLKKVENKDGRRQGAPKMKPKHLKGLASFLWQWEEVVAVMAAIFVSVNCCSFSGRRVWLCNGSTCWPDEASLPVTCCRPAAGGSCGADGCWWTTWEEQQVRRRSWEKVPVFTDKNLIFSHFWENSRIKNSKQFFHLWP